MLESKDQTSSKGLPKWDPRARIGVCLDHSPSHAINAAFVLNPSSDHISPQFHVVFDDEFTIIPTLRSNTVPPNCADLVAKRTESISSSNLESSNVCFNHLYRNVNEP